MSYVEYLTIHGCKIAAEYWDNYVVLSSNCSNPVSFEYELSFNAGRYSEIRVANIDKLANNAFHDLRHVRKVIINDTVKELGRSSFSYCYSLEEVVLPSHLTVLPDETFLNCRQLIKVTLPENIVTIGAKAFKDCNQLRKLIIPSKVSIIEHHAFQNCNSLMNIELPEGLKEIHEGAFCNTGFTEINFPSTITFFGNETFKGCEKLVSIKFTSPSNTSMNMFENCPKLSYVSLSNSMQMIESYTFKKCEKIVRITLPEDMRIVKTNAFEGCSGIEILEIPQKVCILEPLFISGCNRLKSITVHPRNTHFIIDQGALMTYSKNRLILYPALCQNRNFTIPDEIVLFDDKAFAGVNYLKTIILPDNIKFMSIKHAFVDCTSVDQIIYSGTEELRHNMLFFLKGRIRKVVAPYAYRFNNLGGLMITDRTGEFIPEPTPTVKIIVKKSYTAAYIGILITLTLMISIIVIVIKVTSMPVKTPDALLQNS